MGEICPVSLTVIIEIDDGSLDDPVIVTPRDDDPVVCLLSEFSSSYRVHHKQNTYSRKDTWTIGILPEVGDLRTCCRARPVPVIVADRPQ